MDWQSVGAYKRTIEPALTQRFRTRLATQLAPEASRELGLIGWLGPPPGQPRESQLRATAEAPVEPRMSRRMDPES
jgi:hypothetical protein